MRSLKLCLGFRLDGIVRDSKDIEDTRLIYFNKALKLLTETIKSDNTHLKGDFFNPLDIEKILVLLN